MQAFKDYEKFKKRLSSEGIIKAVLIGFLVAFAVAIITAAVCWYFGINALLIVIPEIVVIGSGISLCLYYFKYRPTAKTVAVKVDELGLEERMITMCEYEHDDSYMAEAQRKDAMKALETVNEKMLPIAVSVGLIVFSILSFVGGAFTSSVTVLAAEGKIKSGKEIVSELLEKPAEQYSVRYVSSLFGTLYCPAFNTDGNEELQNELLSKGYVSNDDGSIILYSDGSIEMTVTEGVDGEYIFAIPKKGYTFVQWSDGELSPFRKSSGNGIYSEITAIYEEGDFDIEGYLNKIEANIPTLSDSSHKPYDTGSGNSNSGNNGGGNSSGGGDGLNNFVIDGKTDYRHVYKDYADEGLDRANNDANMNERLKKAINNYYNSIKASSSDETDGNN